jgi:ribosomal protein S18 acetylase RimI-like enzyme
MTIDFVVRRAEAADAPSMARVHVDTWRETYRGLMSDAVLDDPGLLSWRERFWTAALTDPRYSQYAAAVASHEGTLIGIAMSGPTIDDADESQQLYVLYAYAAHHGSGVGTALLDAVIDRTAPAVLWVADPNPRAQAFYRKHGFVADGVVKTEDDVREIRMVRAMQ